MGRTRAVLIGFGNVGRALLREIVEGGLVSRVEIAALLSSRGGVLGGAEDAYRLAREGRRLDHHPGFRETLGLEEILVEAAPDLALVAIPPSYHTGEPNLSIYGELLESGVSIVTADKTGLALRYEWITGEAGRRGLYLGYRATVAAGIPAIDAARGLRGRGVEEVRAVLNATTNYILGLMERGLGYGEAVQRAVEEQLAEPDPRVDTEGWDAAAKLAILSSALGHPSSLGMVERAPLSSLDPSEARRAVLRGARYKYVAEADLVGGRLRVHPRETRPGDPLHDVEGNHNAIVFRLEGGEILLRGPVGPAWRTARTMVTDLLEYLEHYT